MSRAKQSVENTQHMEKLQSHIKSQTTRQKQPGYYLGYGFVQHLIVANFLLSLVLASSGSVFASDEAGKISKYDSTVADSIAVSRVEYDGSTLTFSAISNGCTRTDHFNVRHQVHEGQCRLEIHRTKQDYCRAAPRPISVSIQWPLPDSCKHGNLALTNQLLVQPTKILNPQNKLPLEQKSEKLSQPSLKGVGYPKKP